MGWLPVANQGGLAYYLGTVILDVKDHEGKELTGREMHKMVKRFWPDLGAYINYPFPRFFDHVRRLPYQSDEEIFPERTIELVPRPRYILDGNTMPKVDCKKKAILIAAWAHANGFPYRFIASSEKGTKEIHHVFPQIDFGRGWVNVDATFPHYEIGQSYPVTYAEELTK